MHKRSIIYIGLLSIWIAACNNPDTYAPTKYTPIKITPLNKKLVKPSKIQLADLTPDSSFELWKQFFKERQANSIWKTLSTQTNKIDIEFARFPNFGNPQNNNISNPTDELVQAIIQYLIYYNTTVEQLALSSNILSNNKLNELPPTIVQLTQLKSLDLNQNKISKLPIALFNLTHLNSLNLAGNQLTTLPKEIGKLVKLERLNLVNNQIIDLPITMAHLDQLTDLKLSNNKLTALPQELYPWIQLNFVMLSTIPAAIHHRGIAVNNNPLITPESCKLLTDGIWKEYPYKQDLNNFERKLSLSTIIQSPNNVALAKRIHLNQLMQDRRIVFFNLTSKVEPNIADSIPFYYTQYFTDSQEIKDLLTKNANKNITPPYCILSFPNQQYEELEIQLSKLYITPVNNNPMQ